MARRRMSLAEFAEKHPLRRTGVPCSICVLPELKAVNAAIKSGIPNTTIALWLRNECGYKDMRESRVSHHKRTHL